jgi:hypothetical protein
VTSGIRGGWGSVPEGHECWSSRGNTGGGYGGTRSVCVDGGGSRSGGGGYGGAGVGYAGLDGDGAGTTQFTSFTGTTVQTLTQLWHPILTQRRMRVWMELRQCLYCDSSKDSKLSSTCSSSDVCGCGCSCGKRRRRGTSSSFRTSISAAPAGVPREKKKEGGRSSAGASRAPRASRAARAKKKKKKRKKRGRSAAAARAASGYVLCWRRRRRQLRQVLSLLALLVQTSVTGTN